MTIMKHLFLFTLMLIPMSSWAQGIAEANQAIIDACGKAGGKMTQFTAGKCEFQRCVYDDKKSDGKYYRSGDNKKSNCTDSELKTELDQISTDLNVTVTNGNQSGAQSGSQSGAQSGSQSGAQSGSQSGAQGGSDAGGIECEFVTSGVLSSKHACAKYCKKHWLTGREGTDRKKCRECIERYSLENGGDLVVDWSKIPGGKPSSKKDIVVSGVKVKTGEIICYDTKTGAIVSRTNTGSVCPSGSSTNRGGISIPGGISGSGGVVINSGSVPNGNGSGSVVINTGANGGLALPSFCQTGKRKDQKKCDAWLANNARFQCASSGATAGCVGSGYMNDVQSRYYGDCVNCGGGGKSRDNSWIGDALTGLFVSGGNVMSSYFNGKAYVKGQEAWAGAAAVGFEQCQIHNNNYLQYTISQELPALSPSEQAAMGCNGFQLNQYAGMGYGGMGAWNGAGYSNGYLGGMVGPYGGYNPYGGGGYVGGAVGGYVGGAVGGGFAQGGYAQGGFAGGYPGGYAQGGYAGGGFVNGVSIAGGYAAGVQGGYAGGYAQGGYAGGYAQGGYAAGGYAGGYPGGYAQGGYAGGGFANGVSIAGGYAQGGYAQGGYAGGINGGGYTGGWGTGGWGSGTSQWGGQQNYWNASQQTSGYDQMLQGQGVAYQMGTGGGYGYGGGYGGAGFNPMNAGMGFNASFNGGFNGGW